jgi:hypothetical protein
MTQWVWDRIAAIANWWTFVILLALIVAFQYLAFKPFLSHYQINGQQLQTFDGRMWGFAPGDVEGILGQFKQIGRLGTYALQESTADLVFPIVYGLAFCVAIVLLGGRTAETRCLLVVPILNVVADYIENFNGIAMALTYRASEHVPKALTIIAALASRVKWGLSFAGLAIIIVLLVLRPFRRSDARS